LGGKLWHTQDGAKTWQIAYDDSQGAIRHFEFLNQQTGWLLASGKLQKTSDGGKSWSELNQPINAGAGEIIDFHWFNNGEEAWITGAVYFPVRPGGLDVPPTRYASFDGEAGLQGVIFHTTDAGATWDQRFHSSWGYIGKLFFLDADHLWATGTAAMCRYSGAWEDLDSAHRRFRRTPKCLENEIGFPSAEPVKLFFINGKTGWVTNSNGWIGRTSDGGITWIDIFRVEQGDRPVFLRDLCFRDANVGVGLDSSGKLLETLDGGARWKNIEPRLEGFSLGSGAGGRVYLLASDGVYEIVRG
jgi:photosystem II stability/assembly factor-like uncharacterized protein